MRRRILALVSLTLIAFLPIRAQEQQSPDDTSKMDKAAHDTPADTAPDTPPDTPPAAQPAATPVAPLPHAATPPATMKMSDSDMRDMVGMNSSDGTAHAMRSMQDRKMDMGPHMKMTTLRELEAG